MGYSLQTGAWIRDTSQADLWVTDPQVEFSDDIKPMSDTTLQRVRGIEGVGWAVPMYKGWLKARLPDGTRKQIRIIGLDDATLMGGPPGMVVGDLADLRKDRAVIANFQDLDDKLKGLRKNQNLKVGDHLSINEHDAVVVGTYSATKEFFWEPVLYTTYSRAVGWAPRESKLMNYILVKAGEEQDVSALADRIRQTTGLLARTNAEFELDTMKWLLVNTGILINFGITIALGFLIGMLIAGQTFYTFVLDNLRHFAALMAMGTGRLTILRMMCLQVLLVATVGYGIGVGVAALTGTLLGDTGGFAFQMTPAIPVIGAIGVTICSMLAGLLGIVRVLRLEPAVVFK
jgi:putative ABC transport system permease protein